VTLWCWALGSRTLQPYYAAAVHSMSRDVEAFFLAGFDPAGFVSVGKPPLAFWTQTLGVSVFGFHPWAIALVQAVEGVAAVFVLHRVVRRRAGPGTALLAAALFALTPITAAINRDNVPDTLAGVGRGVRRPRLPDEDARRVDRAARARAGVPPRRA
jgi:4-amino-4-deoxy-L-arabinose transferase-like glycosyltransferase